MMITSIDQLLPKPRYGDPCNGCGMCCIASQCALSEALFGDKELCPALEQAGNSFACGLLTEPARHLNLSGKWPVPILREAFALLLGAGLGCDAGTDDDDPDGAIHAANMVTTSARVAAASPDARQLFHILRGE